MFKHDQPVAPDLAIAIGNPYRPINRMTLLIGARDMLEAVTESEIAVHGDAEIRDGDFEEKLIEFVIDRHPDDFSLEVFKQEYDYYSQDLLDEMEPGFMNYIQTFFEYEGMPNLGDVLANSRWEVSLYDVIRDLKMALNPDLFQRLIDHTFHYAPPYFPLHQFIETPLRPPLTVLTVMDWEIPSTKKGFSDFMERNYTRQDLSEVLGQIDGWLKI
jgi:hypothetical protein